MFIKILLVLIVLLAVFAVFVSTRSADFRVSRTATIPARIAVVFPHINDFHQWNAWSPWAKMDPAAKNTFDGAPAGEGAIYSWAGNSKVGEGRMTLVESRPHELVRIRLEFFKPFAATNSAEFAFQPQGAETVVTWTMTGTNNFMAKAVGLFMDCEKLVGGQFEDGLNNLKTVVSTTAPQS